MGRRPQARGPARRAGRRWLPCAVRRLSRAGRDPLGAARRGRPDSRLQLRLRQPDDDPRLPGASRDGRPLHAARGAPPHAQQPRLRRLRAHLQRGRALGPGDHLRHPLRGRLHPRDLRAPRHQARRRGDGVHDRRHQPAAHGGRAAHLRRRRGPRPARAGGEHGAAGQDARAERRAAAAARGARDAARGDRPLAGADRGDPRLCPARRAAPRARGARGPDARGGRRPAPQPERRARDARRRRAARGGLRPAPAAAGAPEPGRQRGQVPRRRAAARQGVRAARPGRVGPHRAATTASAWTASRPRASSGCSRAPTRRPTGSGSAWRCRGGSSRRTAGASGSSRPPAAAAPSASRFPPDQPLDQVGGALGAGRGAQAAGEGVEPLRSAASPSSRSTAAGSSSGAWP